MKQQLQNVLTRLLAAVLLSAILSPLLLEAQPRRIDPFDPNIGQYTHIGEIRLATTMEAWSIGDCNRDGLNDWIVKREFTDTAFKHFGFLPRRGSELLLFKGVKDSVPSATDAQRIGPEQLNYQVKFLGAGDWNGDSHIDVAAGWRRYDDSLYGVSGTTQYDVVVYWGNESGQYTNADTTILQSRGDAWITVCLGVSEDCNLDGIDDLLLGSCGGSGGVVRLIGGSDAPAPTISMFLGLRGEKWGRNGNAARADWEWWSQPDHNRIGNRFIDQNCDDAPDLVMYNDNPGPIGSQLSILYGTVGGLPDTSNIEIVDLSFPIPSESSQIMDVTGDGVLDLVVLDDLSTAFQTTDSQFFRVYVADPGETISEVYGDGTRPWARVPTTMVLHDGWGGFRNRIYDLGDGNEDGYRDIYFHHYPFLVSYTTGWVLDSLIDGYARFDGNRPQDFVNVGDIDGSGRDAIMVVHRNGLDFVQGGKHINRAGSGRRLPHETAVRRCFSSVSVPAPLQDDGVLKVSPNPATSTVDIRWTITDSWDTGRLEIVDVAGRIVYRSALPDHTGSLLWDAAQVPPGTYIVRAVCNDGGVSASATFVILH